MGRAQRQEVHFGVQAAKRAVKRSCKGATGRPQKFRGVWKSSGGVGCMTPGPVDGLGLPDRGATCTQCFRRRIPQAPCLKRARDTNNA